MTNIEMVDLVVDRATGTMRGYENTLLKHRFRQRTDLVWQNAVLGEPEINLILGQLEEEDGQKHAQAMVDVMAAECEVVINDAEAMISGSKNKLN
jgi:hypothetical protein